MTKIETSILKWHKLEKTAGPLHAASLGTLLALPMAAGGVAGYGYGKVTAPSDKDLKLLQSKYVTSKLEQAVEELENQKKLQILKEKFSGKPNTLRI
jgi:UTP:GlnB (protein PII) uridylyltransferase